MLATIISRQLQRPASLRALSTGRAAWDNSSATADAYNIVAEAADAAPATPKLEVRQRVLRETSTLRPFPATSVIRPHQFTLQSRKKPRTYRPSVPRVGPSVKEAREKDLFHQLSLDPVDFASTPSLLNEYLTAMGKIKNRPNTQLTRKSQRRLGKAIRRSRMMGIIPTFSLRQQPLGNMPIIPQRSQQ